ncbi:hypothetical protein GH714_000736 [Hevea brasiliensis]|uniref:Uncharacterized protein n=1 Tax=Hevea brasiliensis TaxID=3981 RepID=A0A6A6N8B5_HEVBR|nr:hypothetical protein GH714_000736 [Hevea brasiliensis]
MEVTATLNTSGFPRPSSTAVTALFSGFPRPSSTAVTALFSGVSLVSTLNKSPLVARPVERISRLLADGLGVSIPTG